MKVLVDIDIPYIKGVLEPYFEVVYLKGVDFTVDDVRDADALIVRTRTNCSAELLKGSGVRFIATATIGTDHINIEWCKKMGITVVSAAGCNARGVLQWITAALVYDSKRELWIPSEKILGIVGVGHVGSLVADCAEQWGFKVLRCDPIRQRSEGLNDYVDFDTIIKTCDIITFHTPLTRGGEFPTFQMMSHEMVAKLRSGVLILNSSRGEVVETDAFLLHHKMGGRCCIDTWESEPNINKELLSKALIATPHIAGYSKQGKATATAMSVQSISQEFELPIQRWFPKEVTANLDPIIPTWNELCISMKEWYDIESDSDALKSSITKFEDMRNSYNYRDERF